MKKNTLKITQIALMSCVMAICAQIAIPLGGIPLTLQTFAVAFCGYLLGIFGAMTTVFVYLLLGAIGLPVFSGFGSSFAFLIGPSGGYLFGFLIFAAFCGAARHCRSFLYMTLLSLIGLFFCHIIGILWFSYISGNPLFQSFLLTSAPYLIKDILSFIFAYFLIQKIRQRCPNLLIFHASS